MYKLRHNHYSDIMYLLFFTDLIHVEKGLTQHVDSKIQVVSPDFNFHSHNILKRIIKYNPNFIFTLKKNNKITFLKVFNITSLKLTKQ
jgi:hypothetical protein